MRASSRNNSRAVNHAQRRRLPLMWRKFRKVESRLAKGATLFTTVAHSDRMSRIRQLGTEPELAVRAAARAAAARFTVQNRDLPGSPDLANRTRRLAVF